MKKYSLNDFIGGWIIGDFPTSIIKNNKDFEIAIKKYRSGVVIANHMHKESDEYSVIICGKILINGYEFNKDDIISIKKNTATEWNVIEDTILVRIKIPSNVSDKYLVIKDGASI